MARFDARGSSVTADMLHTVLRRRANSESVEDIQPDLIIPVGKRKGRNPTVASIYRALAEHAKREAYPEAVDQAHADFAAGARSRSGDRRSASRRPRRWSSASRRQGLRRTRAP
ncbi:hypothetical protein AB0L13_29040 [Saccharopolyspora shandongensis]|uniref:hypothetical protein n=1 Tax=Saccharopolyspora shandongensis TaxID=418495 RepID=UPI0034429B1D